MNFALALQGIGGMNSFSAGILAYLRKEKIVPSMVSVTSGAISTFFHYLDEDEKKLENLFKHGNEHYTKSIVSKEMQGMLLFYKYVTKGMPGIFKNVPMWKRLQNCSISDFSNPFELINILSPAQTMESQIKDEYFENIAERYCKSNIPIITNAYNYDTGKAVIFLNPAGQKRLKDTRFKIGENDDFSVREISPEAIKGALQLVQFGPYKGMLDGAYQYNPFLAPLKTMDKLFLVTVVPITKPLKPMENTFDVEDFKLKMLFLNSIFSEIHNIDLLNKLIENKIINHESMHKIDFNIIEPGLQKGFFDYFVEDVDLFEDGFRKAEIFKN